MTGLSRAQDLGPREGFVQVDGGKVWYKIVGEGKGLPLLFIHGGPGASACPLMFDYPALSAERPLIFYDQLGTGKSERVNDPSLWTPKRFAGEIDSLRKALGLRELHILGQSWGGTVLIEYLSTRPKGIRSAIFSGPLISTSVWMRDANWLLSTLPRNLQDTIKKYEAIKDYGSPSYLAATDSFYYRYLSRYNMPMVRACDVLHPPNGDIYLHMWGPTEFTATGTLRGYDRTRDLKSIRVPVLFISGEFDEVRAETIRAFRRKVRGAESVIIPDAGHYIQTDQPRLFESAIRQYIHSLAH